MRAHAVHVFSVSLLLVALACGGGAAGREAPDAAPMPGKDDASFSAHGLTIERPSRWSFVAPDETVPAGVIVIMHGPIGDHTLAPVVEVSFRKLGAADRRRNPEHILGALASEMVQASEGLETTTPAEPTEIGGQSGARIFMKLTETLPDGGSVERQARFYAFLVEGGVIVIRCVGPADGSSDSDFDAIVGSVSI